LTYQEIIDTYPIHKEEAIERAAIIEYDAELTREQAENATAKRLHEKYLLFSQGNLFHSGSIDKQRDI